MSDTKYIIKNGDSVIAALREKGYVKPENHFYLKFDKHAIPGLNTEMTFFLLDCYLAKIKQSHSMWKGDNKQYTIEWNNKITNKKEISQPINYYIFSKHLRENNGFNPNKLNLPETGCNWLDTSADISINFHKFDKGSKNALTVADGTPQSQFGDKYPIKPLLDREGHYFTSFHPQLIRKIIKDRKKLIENSNQALHYDWILDLRTIINDAISLIDITLNLFYIKAEYSPEKGWKFDKKVLGERNSRRLTDKLKWIRQITGNEFNYEPERENLLKLKNIRNHLNHFDPPSLVITLEEATEWLNNLIDIGLILLRIRKAIGVQTSKDLINFILQKKVVFNPEPTFKKRLPLDQNKGYNSTKW